MSDVNAKDILALLATRHSNDVFVAECKNGPTWNAEGTMQKMDAWAMKRSWSNPCAWCYEIKVNRSDFLKDDKWPGYLPLCNQFYFVTPWKLIALEEVPEGVGLIYASQNASRLYTQRKAPHRSIELPNDLLQYILQSRAKISSGDVVSEHDENLVYWTEWLKTKELSAVVGWRVSKALRKIIEEQIDAVESQNRILEKRCDGYDGLIKILETLGIDPRSYSTWNAERILREAVQRVRTGIPHGMTESLDAAIGKMTLLKEHFGKLTAQAEIDTNN